jgi:hypothetical protein
MPLRDVECRPGQPAPQSGWYLLLNVFGTPDGEERFIERGQPAPAAPVGYHWQLRGEPLDSQDGGRLLERAAEMRSMALTARSMATAEALIRLAERFERLASERKTAAD